MCHLEGLRPDLVVLNSVVQYFPSPEYLMEVVEGLAQIPGVQRLFFGDIRSYATNRDFLAARALNELGENATRTDIRRNMANLEENEEELLVDPAFFTGLTSRLPSQVGHVEILPKRMRATNELSSYRYAAVVHIHGKQMQGPTVHAIDASTWFDFTASQMQRPDLLRLLQSSPDAQAIVVSNIPNSKTILERHIIESLDDDDVDGQLDGAAWISAVRRRARTLPIVVSHRHRPAGRGVRIPRRAQLGAAAVPESVHSMPSSIVFRCVNEGEAPAVVQFPADGQRSTIEHAHEPADYIGYRVAGRRLRSTSSYRICFHPAWSQHGS